MLVRIGMRLRAFIFIRHVISALGFGMGRRGVQRDPASNPNYLLTKRARTLSYCFGVLIICLPFVSD